MADCIPHELVVHILARLPAVSLLRFKTVCKSWKTLISSPSFVTEQLNTRSKANSGKILLEVYTKADHQMRYLLCRDNEDEFSELGFLIVMSPSLPRFAYFRIGGSVNGILCLHVDFDWVTSQIILWNPSTRKSVTIPKPEAMPLFLLGFGVHPTTHEYKVVTIKYDMSQTLPASDTNVYVYTQATGWRKVGSTFPPYCFRKYMTAAPQVFVNGAVNWIGKDRRVSIGCHNFTVSFDMSTETFSVLTLPPTLANQETLSLSLKDFQGSLAVLCDQERDNGACSMWVMKEYGVPESWTKLFSFKLDLPVIVRRALGLRKNGEVLLWTTDFRCLSYDIGTKALTDTGMWYNAMIPVQAVPFVETLVSVEN